MKLKELIESGKVCIRIRDERVMKLFNLADIVDPQQIPSSPYISEAAKKVLLPVCTNGDFYLFGPVYMKQSTQNAKEYFGEQEIISKKETTKDLLSFVRDEEIYDILRKKSVVLRAKKIYSDGVTQVVGFGHVWDEKKWEGKIKDTCWAFYGHIRTA